MTNDQTVTQALEPCPFCGGLAEWKEDTGAFDEPFGLVTAHDPACFFKQGLATEEAIVAAWNTRTAHSGEGRDAIIERCARIADGWNRGRDDRVTETSIAAAIRDLSGEGRSNGAGEDVKAILLEAEHAILNLEPAVAHMSSARKIDRKSAFAVIWKVRRSLAAALSAPQGEVERIADIVESRISAEFKGFWTREDLVEEIPGMIREAARAALAQPEAGGE